MIVLPIRASRLRTASSCSSRDRAAVDVDALGAHRPEPDHRRRDRGRASDVAADALAVLAVEDVLGRHRAESHRQAAHPAAAEAIEALLLLHALVVPERAAALADRQPRREHVLLHVDVAGGGVSRLVDGDRSRLLLDVVDVLGGAGLDGRHRLDDVEPAEPPAALGVGDRERHRAALLDHRRRVPVRDPRELITAPVGVEVRLVIDLVEVEVEDVGAIVLGRSAEPDVASHPARPGQRRIEHLDRDVARADEVNLLGARPRRREPQRHLSDLARDHEHRVEERVEPVGEELPHHRRLVDPVHHDQQLVQRLAAAHPRPSRNPGRSAGSARSRARTKVA